MRLARPMRLVRHALAAAVVTLCAAGCSSPADSVTKAWKGAGHTVTDLKPAEKELAGGKCSAGAADGLDVTLCEYGDAEAAKKAEEAGFELVGKVVGTSVAAGKMVLVVADTRKEDPSGRRLNELVKVFREAMD
jgi:hypothetical protein